MMNFRRSIIRSILTWFAATLIISMAAAQLALAIETASTQPQADYPFDDDVAKYPLKPADTSSPRDTLRSFLTEYYFAVEEAQRSGVVKSQERALAYLRALSTMDFSATPDSDSRTIMNGRLAMLHEILARIELPPYSEIPGDEEVAEGNLNEWTIPGSRITITRIKNGPRAGEFLFSAWTVQRLHRFYRMIKHLPYQPGASPGTYETALRSQNTLINRESPVRYRLKPVDTSSPRTTLEGFLDSVNRAYGIVMKTDAAFKSSPPAITMDEARQQEILARNLMLRAQAALDLSKVPEAIRYNVGIESVLLLKEILDRMTLPSIEVVPDKEMLAVSRKQLSSSAAPIRWRYPNTTMEIVEIVEGKQQGQFLFSAGSIANLKAFYKKIRDLPYRQDLPVLKFEYKSPDTSKGFYEYYIASPGDLIPYDSAFGQLVKGLPDWFNTLIGGQTIWQWISLAVSLFLFGSALVVFHHVLVRHFVSNSPASRNWQRVFFNLFAIGVLYTFFWIFENTINLTGSVLMVVITGLTLAVWYFLATGVLFLSNAVAEMIIASPKIDPAGVRASYFRAVFGLFGLTAMVVLMITGLFRVGVSVGPLLASVGIGGLAIALAARPTLENIIGSFMIFMDKPYRVGQRVHVMGQDGTVESIGLRSTKIRLLTGHLTSIPNQQMANAEIENIGRRPYIRRLLNVTITYDTPPEKINRAVNILREILSVPAALALQTTDSAVPLSNTDTAEGEAIRQPHPNEAINKPGFPPRVYFNDLNADSLNILVLYWYHPPDYWNYLEHANWINMQIMERFNAEGIDFALPTQRLHMAGDDKRPLAIGRG